MRIRTGLDAVEICRIEKVLKKSGFLKRIMSDTEFDYFEKTGRRPEHAAALWCAKEALAKALGSGFRGFSFRDIEILHDDFSKPYYRLSRGASELARNLFAVSIDLSISHDKTTAYAVAVVLSEEENEGLQCR